VIGGKVEGLDKLLANLANLEKKAAKKLVKQAVTAGSDIVQRATAPGLPRDTGSLAASWGKKVSTPRKTGVAIGIVGARRKFKKDKKTGKRVLTKAGQKFVGNRWPSKYFHLVEFGTKARVQKTTGRPTGAMKPKRVLTKGTASSAPAVQSKMADVFKTGLGL
jgi:HK97 gp10 family phage protein